MNRADTSDQIWGIKDPLDVRVDKNHSAGLNKAVEQRCGGGES